MDRNYYAEKIAQQRQREAAELWAHPREPREPLTRKQARRLVLRLAFAVIALSALIYLI
jgi:hypothetical protein